MRYVHLILEYCNESGPNGDRLVGVREAFDTLPLDGAF